MDLSLLQKRAAIIKQVRSFFDNKNYLELDTPLLSCDLIPEACLEVFQTERIFPHGSKKENRPLWSANDIHFSLLQKLILFLPHRTGAHRRGYYRAFSRVRQFRDVFE